MIRKTRIYLLVLVLLLLAGCSKPAVFDGSRVTNETGFHMDYTALNREETAVLELSEGDLLQVVLSHTGGSVDVIIGQEGKEPVYKGTGQENAAFDVTIPETGRYRISVTGHQAKGTVSFTHVPGAGE